MKKIAALILCAAMIFSLCACGHKEKGEPEPEPTQSAAPVDEDIPEAGYTKDDGVLDREITYNPNGLKCATTIYEYDGSGRVVKESFYGVNDAPTGYNTYEYAPDGRMTKISYLATGPEEFEEDYRSVTEYNMQGDKIKETQYYGEEIAAVTAYEYDNAGVLQSEKYYEGESELVAEYSYSYENGRVSAVLRHDYLEDDSVTDRYTYNADGLVTSDICYDSQENIVSRTEYSYDKNGSETRCGVYSASGELVAATDNAYTYDEPGNIIRCVRTYTDGTQGSTIEYCWIYTKG